MSGDQAVTTGRPYRVDGTRVCHPLALACHRGLPGGGRCERPADHEGDCDPTPDRPEFYADPHPPHPCPRPGCPVITVAAAACSVTCADAMHAARKKARRAVARAEASGARAEQALLAEVNAARAEAGLAPYTVLPRSYLTAAVANRRSADRDQRGEPPIPERNPERCPRADKVAYPTRDAALDALRRITATGARGLQDLAPYHCVGEKRGCGWWHLGNRVPRLERKIGEAFGHTPLVPRGWRST